MGEGCASLLIAGLSCRQGEADDRGRAYCTYLYLFFVNIVKMGFSTVRWINEGKEKENSLPLSGLNYGRKIPLDEANCSIMQ